MKIICRVNKTDRAFPTHPVSEQAYYSQISDELYMAIMECG